MRIYLAIPILFLGLLSATAAEDTKKERHPLVVIADAQKRLKNLREDMDDEKVLDALKIPDSWELSERYASAATGYTRTYSDPSEGYFIVVDTTYRDHTDLSKGYRIRLVEFFVRSTQTRVEAGTKQKKTIDVRIGKHWENRKIVDEAPFFLDGTWETVEEESPAEKPEPEADKSTEK